MTEQVWAAGCVKTLTEYVWPVASFTGSNTNGPFTDTVMVLGEPPERCRRSVQCLASVQSAHGAADRKSRVHAGDGDIGDVRGVPLPFVTEQVCCVGCVTTLAT